jgi:hypothetical protein
VIENEKIIKLERMETKRGKNEYSEEKGDSKKLR